MAPLSLLSSHGDYSLTVFVQQFLVKKFHKNVSITNGNSEQSVFEITKDVLTDFLDTILDTRDICLTANKLLDSYLGIMEWRQICKNSAKIGLIRTMDKLSVKKVSTLGYFQ